MNFPLARHPGVIVIVDDDESYLSIVQATLPPKMCIKPFTAAGEFVEYMTSKVAILKDMDAYLQGSVDRYKKSGSVAIEVVRFWNAFPERFALPQVVVIDYYMPHMNGLEALEKCKGWPGQKVLVTGVADEEVVCRAFNERRIDYYVPKQNAKIMQKIVSAIELMTNNHSDTNEAQWSAWHVSMLPEQKLVMRDPQVATALFEFVGENHEHVVIGDPFGVLALGYEGGIKWLQLETTASLDAAADMALKMGASKADVQNVRAGQMLTDARIKAALNIDAPPAFANASFRTRMPGTHEVLIGAAFDVAAAGAPSADMCYAAWRERQSN